MPKIEVLTKETIIVTDPKLFNSFETVSKLGLPTFVGKRPEESLIQYYYKLIELSQDDHNNYFLKIDEEAYKCYTSSECGENLVLINVNEVLYSCIVEDGEILVAKGFTEYDFSVINVICESSVKKLMDNITELNTYLFGRLLEEVTSPSFKDNYPWVSDIAKSADNCIKMDATLQQDSNRDVSKMFRITIEQNMDFDSIRPIKISTSMPCFSVFTLVGDLEGFAQDLNLIKIGVESIYSYLVSKTLFDYGIKSSDELLKLNRIELNRVSDTIENN